MDVINYFFRYIDDNGVEALKKWKYQGGEYTFLDNLMNPFWIWCETKTPRWLSPNAVTLTATVFLFLSTMFIAVFGHLFEDRMPLYALTIFSQFAYQTLDAVDGKHARALGMASPFGSMLDHGCDTFSTFLQGVLILLTVSPTLDIDIGFFLAFMIAHTAFFLAQWAAAYDGKLETAGVTEAGFLAMALPLFNVVFGPDVWRWPIVKHSVAPTLVFIGILIAGPFVFRAIRLVGVKVIFTLLPIVFINAIALYIFYSGLFAQQPLFTLTTLGLTYVLTSLRLVIGNMVAEPIKTFRMMLPSCMLALAAMIPSLFFPLFVADAIIVCYIAVDTTTRVCHGLNIPVISVQVKNN